MKRLRDSLPLFLSLLVCLLLAACGGGEETPPPPDNSDGAYQEGRPGQTASLRMLLPRGPTAEACAAYSEPDLSDDSGARAKALLEGKADIVALSSRTAADLFHGGAAVQVLAVTSPGTRYTPDSMECLVALSAWLAEDPVRVEDFLAALSLAVPGVEDAYLATGWDMLDLVQGELEAQYLDAPSPDRTVPDSSFFYLPGI